VSRDENLERLHLLVLDELGYVPCSKAGAELLFVFLVARGFALSQPEICERWREQR